MNNPHLTYEQFKAAVEYLVKAGQLQEAPEEELKKLWAERQSQTNRKLVALIPGSGKTREQITKEVVEVCRRAGLLKEDSKK